MANDLTGDFDAVVQFSIGAADRVLAAMHRANRFPHSLSPRVSDASGLPPWALTTLTYIVDRLGNAIATFGPLAKFTGPLQSAATTKTVRLVNFVVNKGVLDKIVAYGQRSGLQGIAQLQLSTPVLTIPDAWGEHVTLRIQTMARYFPDPDTRALAKYIHGMIQISVGVNQVATQAGNVVKINVDPAKLNVQFTQLWASMTPTGANMALTGNDVNAIQKAVHNSIVTSFQGSNATLPPSIKHMRFKTLPGALPAVSFLLNMHDEWSDPGSVYQVFLAPDDDFAFAVGADFLVNQFTSSVNSTLDKSRQRHFPFSFEVVVKVWTPFGEAVIARHTYTYDVSLDKVTVEVLAGQILLTVDGHAHSDSPAPDFTFHVKQAFTLKLIDATAALDTLGDVSVKIDNPGGLAGTIFGPFITSFESSAINQLRPIVASMMNEAQGRIMEMLSADSNFKEFFRKMMNPHPAPGAPPPEVVNPPTLTYTDFEISPSGVVLHGSLAVQAWPAVRATFALDSTGEFSALNSWIPGGTIQQHVWTDESGSKALWTDHHTFIFESPWRFNPALNSLQASFVSARMQQDVKVESPAYPIPGGQIMSFTLGVNPSCLTVKGRRISAWGPVVYRDVSGHFCRWHALPLGSLGIAANLRIAGQTLPDIALTLPAASGALEVVGHICPSSLVKRAGECNSNVIVHFSGGDTPGNLNSLQQALRESGRNDTATAILAVLPGEGLAKIRPVEGLLFAEDHDGTWGRLFRVNHRPATIVVGPSGELLWRHEGELPPGQLAEALRKHLAAGGVFSPRLLELDVSIGEAPPDFLFECAPGVELTLRKLVGHPVALVFWKSSSRPSMEMVRRLQTLFEKASEPAPIVLAVNDGEDSELATRAAAHAGLSAIVVADPQRAISFAYGVNVWPTTVGLDVRGLISYVWHGLFSLEQAGQASQSETPPPQPARRDTSGRLQDYQQSSTPKRGETRRAEKE
jgi:hypothetical protein